LGGGEIPAALAMGHDQSIEGSPGAGAAVRLVSGETRLNPTPMQASAAKRPSSSRPRVVLVTERAAVEAFFREVIASASVEFALERMSSESIDRGCADSAAVAVVDVALEPLAAIRCCRTLAELRPDLPIVGVVCCPYALTPWSLHALLSSGIASMLDLRSSKNEVASALQLIAAGSSVLEIRVGWGYRPLFREIFARDDPRAELDLRMLELLALGLPDREMGRRLHLSPHTVKHHVEHLRWALGLRNRIELAAWAGRHGFYGDGVHQPTAHEIPSGGSSVASTRHAV